VTTLPDDDLPGTGPAPLRANAVAAAVALAGGFAAVLLSWELAGALVGFAAFLAWNARRDAIERRADAKAPARWYVGAHRELELVGADAHQAELQRLAERRGRAWVSGMLRPVSTGSATGAVTLDVDGAVLGALSDASVARYRSRHGDTPTAVAFAIVEREGRLAVVFV
jgi:hypothetical protein